MLTRMKHDLVVKARRTIQKSWTVNRMLFLIQNLWINARSAVLSPVRRASMSVEPPERFLSVMVRVKDEGPFIVEWICHHIGLGVEHFYVYDNASSDDTRARLAPLIRAGRVTYVYWPTVPITPSAENDFFRRFARESRWVAFIDSDEFIEVRSTRPLTEILASHDAPALALNWRLFGSSWHAGVPDGMVTKNFEFAAESLDNHIKVIAQPREIVSLRNPHNFYYRRCRLARTLKGSRAYGTFADPGDSEGHEVELRHYVVRSVEDDYRKSVRGDAEAPVRYSRWRNPAHVNARYHLYNDIRRPLGSEQLERTASLIALSTGTHKQLEGASR